MTFREIFRLVLINLRGNKFKVLLTSLGIIVGAATIVLVIAIGKGGQADVADQFKNLNAGAIDITYSQTIGGGMGGGMDMGGFGGGGMAMPSGGGGFPSGGGGGMAMPSGGGMPDMGSFDMGSLPDMGDLPGMDMSGILTQNEEVTVLGLEDVEDIQLFVPGIATATIYTSTTTTVSGGELEEETSYTVAGVVESYVEVSNLSLLVGSFITAENNEQAERVVVLGYTLAVEIFGSVMNAYDSVVYIDESPYVVNGVLEQMGNVSAGISPDTTLFIPYDTMQKYILGSGNVDPTITVVAGNVNDVAAVMENVETLLAQYYPNSTFTLSDAGSTMEAAQSSANTLSYLLVAVASIVFIVGGIGIMNVMFVSVRERTAEIGVLKALGAGRLDIVVEFLVESNMISTLGGLLGVAVGYAAIPLVNSLGMRAEVSVLSAVLALAFSILTGTIFGIYPAIKASLLVPIQALNQE